MATAIVENRIPKPPPPPDPNAAAKAQAKAQAEAAAKAEAVARANAPKPMNVVRAPGPAEGVESTPAPQEMAVIRAAGPAEGVESTPASTGTPEPPKAPVKSSFDLQREQVAADRVVEDARRQAAVERYFTNRGLGDSGILAGAERAERANVAAEAGRALSGIGQEESRQAFTAGQADIDRTINQQQFNASLAQARELSLAGLDIQKMSIALQEKGMNQQNAQFVASLAQADRHAERGFTLQESQQSLIAEGMQAEDARYYAGLGQARYLAQQGLDQNAVALALQEKGMAQQDAQFFASLAQQENLFDKANVADIQKGFLAAGLEKVKFDTPEGIRAFNSLLESFGLGAYKIPEPAASKGAATTQPTSTASTTSGDQYVNAGGRIVR